MVSQEFIKIYPIYSVRGIVCGSARSSALLGAAIFWMPAIKIFNTRRSRTVEEIGYDLATIGLKQRVLMLEAT